MKVVILAGGLGTRLMEETIVRPKPMVEIGGKPILWHIMQVYASQGFNDFVVAAGYKGDVIKDYFLNYHLINSDLRIDFATGEIGPAHEMQTCQTDWRVEVVDTGAETLTGGRIKRLQPYIGDETFMATYGDGLADVDVRALLDFHRNHGKIATLSAVRPPETADVLDFESGRVAGFHEDADEGRVNGGFFVFEPAIFDCLRSDSDVLETTALTRLARVGELAAYRHDGFWQCMDTIEERRYLEGLWARGDAPWARTGAAAAMNRG